MEIQIGNVNTTARDQIGNDEEWSTIATTLHELIEFLNDWDGDRLWLTDHGDSVDVVKSQSIANFWFRIKEEGGE